MTRVLVVDDDPALLRALGINLRARKYAVDAAATGAEALETASRHPPEAVILDLGLPDMDGVAVIEGLRGWSRAPIIVLSARGAQQDKVSALDAGADDYVTKPFGMDELLARLRASLRRTPTEWHLLEILIRHEGKLVSQRQLLQDVWGPRYETETNYLRVYMAQLRRKLEPEPAHPRHLLTEPGMGYRFVRQPGRPAAP